MPVGLARKDPSKSTEFSNFYISFEYGVRTYDWVGETEWVTE